MARTRIRNQLLALVMAGALVATAAACGSSKKDDQASSSTSSAQSEESTTTTKAKTSGTTTPADEMADALNKLGQGDMGNCMEIAMTYAAALRLLAVEADTDGDKVKQAYRRMVSRHHPDKLAGTGASEAQVREATERTRELHQAYAMIRKRRGL